MKLTSARVINQGKLTALLLCQWCVASSAYVVVSVAAVVV